MTTILKIYHDDNAESPRDWDNLCTMVCWHGRYQLGDEQPNNDPLDYMEQLIEEHQPGFVDAVEERAEEFWEGKEFYEQTPRQKNNMLLEWDEIHRNVIHTAFDKHFYSLPLYLYDHSGITISTGPFSCPWDSGQIGFIYLSHDRADQEIGTQYPSAHPNGQVYDTRHDHVMAIMRGEVETYDQYIRGEVFGFRVEKDDTLIDSCWGFFGRDWRKNGIADHIVDEIDEVWYMEDCTVTVSKPADKEVLQ